MIFSPVEASMIESGQPNACNLCHTGESISWTRTHLKDWYGKSYSDTEIQKSYPDPDAPVAAVWLDSSNEAVRLIATDAVARAQDESLLSLLINGLDDEFLLNRQFTRIALEKMLPVTLSDFGYRFYMTSAERAGPIAEIRAALQSGKIPRAAQNDQQQKPSAE